MVSENATTYIVFPHVQLGLNATIQDWVVIGEPPKSTQVGELLTVIGDNAVIRSHSVIYAGNSIGDSFQTGHGVLIRENNVIGNNVSIGSHSIVEHHVEINEGVRIHSNAFIPEYSILESGCWIGPGVIFTNAKYPLSHNVKKNLVGPRIQTNAKIGAGSVILPGLVIGKNALVGAGTVVTKNVPDGAVVVGNPGRIIGNISEIDEYERN